MKTRSLMYFVLIVSSSVLVSLFIISDISYETHSKDSRDDLEKVVNSNTVCSIHYRTELWDMSSNKTYDYKNDPIFQECSWVLELEKNTNTDYDPNPNQLEAILEHCIDSKDLVDTIGLSYSNDTHYIDTTSCEWQKLEMMKNEMNGCPVMHLGHIWQDCGSIFTWSILGIPLLMIIVAPVGIVLAVVIWRIRK